MSGRPLTPEYKCMRDCLTDLRLAVRADLLWLCGELHANRLISEDKERSLRNRNVDEADRVAELCSLLIDKVRLDPENYHVFLEILKKKERFFKEIIALLGDYSADTQTGNEATSSPSANNHSEEELDMLTDEYAAVKSKPVHAAGKAQSGRLLVDSSCQTSVTNSIHHHPVHPAFGATCGCNICKSDLGCPQPITAETTFPLLEHMDGLDKIQKEDLRMRLKKDTEQIMMEFYKLLSEFFKSLKCSKEVSVEDLKTHLMVLDAFNDDNQQQAVFLEQREKLEQASTINEVFKVFKVFCSYFNYDLVEYLINLIGTDEDKVRIGEYKEKFTEYAKRRVYECATKTAMCTPGQWDMYIKLESRYSENMTLNELRGFRLTISDLLKVSHHVVRLCCIEKGCIRLTFQIPEFVKQRVFPLTSEQESRLLQLGIIQLICGDYEFHAKDKPEILSMNDSNAVDSRGNAKSCLDCISNTGEISLCCKAHFVCNDCLVKRTKTIVSSEDLLMCTCDQVTSWSRLAKLTDSQQSYRDALMNRQPEEAQKSTGEKQLAMLQPKSPTQMRGVWMFVNDSNIWIEAKKLQSKHKMFKTGEDHRVRMDMGKLADVLAKGRPIRQGRLYGSEPPSIDTVWEKIRDQGWKVHTSPRTPKHGKEKQLTTKFVVDVVSLAEKTPPEERSTIILVSGDASIIPAIEKVVEVDGWNVEVYMWSHATSKQLPKLQFKHDNRITVHSLDPYLSDITFTNMKFTYSNKNFLEKVKNSSIVFTVDDDPSSFPGHVPTDLWMSKLEELAQWPCQYYWYHHPDTGQTSKLVVVFKRDAKAGTFDVMSFLAKVTSGVKIPSVVSAQSFVEFTSSERLDQLGGDFEQIGIFNRNDVQDGVLSDSVYVSCTSIHSSLLNIKKWSTRILT